jgi:hypothetical protein
MNVTVVTHRHLAQEQATTNKVFMATNHLGLGSGALDCCRAASGGAAKNLDWLNGHSQALSMLDRAASTKGYFDSLLVVPPDVCIQEGDELIDGRVKPVARKGHLDLQSAKEALTCGVVWRTPFARHGASQLGVGNPL